MRVLPPTYLLLAILLMVALRLLAPLGKGLIFPWSLGGLIPLGLGIGIATWASRIFDRVGTTVKPFEESTDLVTTGPFRLSRHPMYVGMTLAVAGIAILLGGISPLVGIPAYALVMDRFARLEERQMEETFGEAYREYKVTVRRWI